MSVNMLRPYLGAREALVSVGCNARVFEMTMSSYAADRFRYSVELKLEFGR